MSDNAVFSEARCAQYEFNLTIPASVARVWHALAHQVNDWWLTSFHMLGPQSVVQLEFKAGGRLFEFAGEHQLLWYTVIAIVPGESIELAGYCSAKYGGPTTTMIAIELSELTPATTQLRFSDSLFGKVTDGQVNSLCNGWKELFTDGLLRFVMNNVEMPAVEGG